MTLDQYYCLTKPSTVLSIGGLAVVNLGQTSLPPCLELLSKVNGISSMFVQVTAKGKGVGEGIQL